MTRVLRRQWHPIPVLLAGKSHGRRSLEGRGPWGRWGSDTIERLHFHFSLSCIGEGNGNPLHVSCLENPRDGGAWWAAICGVTQSQTWLKWLSSSRVLIKETNRKGKNLLFILFSNDFMELQTFTKALKSTLRTVSYNVNNAAFCSLVFLTLLSDLREDLFSFFLLGFAPEI